MMMQKKKVLVTGSDGFIGRSLVNRLNELGCEVQTFDVKDGDISAGLPDFGDIHHVFHLAALTYVPASWDNPEQFYRVNVMGTVQVLEFCRRKSCSFTMPGTYMYGNPQYLPIDEKHPENCNISPYHHSKGTAESICRFYAEQFKLSGVILRLFNVFGPKQNSSFLIPMLIEKTLNSDAEIEVFDLAPKRDYVYLDDVISAFISSVQYDKPGQLGVFNVGSGKSWSVKEIIDAIADEWGIHKPYHDKGSRRKNEVMDTVADTALIQRELKWQPENDLRSGLKKMHQLQCLD